MSTKTRTALTYETLPALFTGICDAIRAKTGATGNINHQDIPSAISNIPAGVSLATTTGRSSWTSSYVASSTHTAAHDGLMVIFSLGQYYNVDGRMNSAKINDVDVPFSTQMLNDLGGGSVTTNIIAVKAGDVVTCTYNGGVRTSMYEIY